MQFLEDNPKMKKGWIQAWKHRNDPKIRKNAREKMVKTLEMFIDDTDELAELTEQLLDEQYEDSPPIVTEDAQEDNDVVITRMTCAPSTEDLRDAIQPISYPPYAFCQPTMPEHKAIPPITTATVNKSARCDLKRKALGDTGANATVTQMIQHCFIITPLRRATIPLAMITFIDVQLVRVL
jgi:hypothetical protein